jgi:pyroglutamyl-peptidase
MRTKRTVLVTGFEPYSGFDRNPSAEIAKALNGNTIGGLKIVGRVLPVDLKKLGGALRRATSAVDPAAMILLGLAPGESVIRLERVALNLADFSIPDNTGQRAIDRALDAGGDVALWSRLPLRRIQRALLKAGIPTRLSETAGTYLCNAALHWALRTLPAEVQCGFIHLPHLPEYVATALLRDSGGHIQPSMALSLQRQAIEIAIATTLKKSP